MDFMLIAPICMYHEKRALSQLRLNGEKHVQRQLYFLPNKQKEGKEKKKGCNKALVLRCSATGCIHKAKPSAPHRHADLSILVRRACYLLAAAPSVPYITPWRKG